MAKNYSYENLENSKQFKDKLRKKLTEKGKSDDIYNFVLNLREYCFKNELNQSDVARKLNIKLSTINPYFNGDGVPTLDTLILMSKKLNVSLDFLVGLSKNTTITNELIRNETGLNDSSINTLKDINDKKLSLVLNDFFNNQDFVCDCLNELSNFKTQIKAINHNYQYDVFNKEENSINKKQLTKEAKKDLMFYIYENLSKEIDNIVNDIEKQVEKEFKEEVVDNEQ